LVSAIFLYISRAGFGDLSDPRQPCLTRFGKFCGVCFNAGYNAPSPGSTPAHFALMSATQTPADRCCAIATGAERSTTVAIAMILFIIDHSPKKEKVMRMSSLGTLGQREMRTDQGCIWTINATVA
ncbi:MAG: hypothetical protein WA704_02480, partial [Pseudolabrys sp.]